MDNDINTGLTIIKASAGSGKTHRLTYEYVKLVLADPQKFKNILAVTFTNKATAEMKSRILSELQTIARHPPKSKMIEELTQDLNQDIQSLSQIAFQLVKSILHQYAFFNVSTIDHFFQNIIRSLTKELGLNGGYRIQLDKDEIIEAAVEKFLHDLYENEEQMNIMLEYIDSQMDDEKSWNVNRHLIDFTKQLFREQVRHFFIKNNGSITGETPIKHVKSKLKETISKFEEKANKWIKQYDALIDSANLQPEDFTGKTKNPLLSAKNKIKQKKYTELDKNIENINNQDQWSHKKSENAILVESLAPEFDKLSNELASLYEIDLPLYLEASAIYKRIFQQALASGLMKKVSEILADQNLFMLADAPVLLNLFTDGQDTPFIYEKSGCIFRHYMIDEFQDTSALQWENFKPLLEESLAMGYSGNFIVGDVKQAIYRWRNGDWTLLHKKVGQQIRQTTTEILNQNWRSKENIIKFNNLFFKQIISIVGDELGERYASELQEIYSDIEQYIPNQLEEKKKGGYVFIKSIDEKKRDDFIQASLVELKNRIITLKENYQIDDICILVRKNDELTAVSEYLINETNYEIISSGSLTLGSSKLLQIIITCLRYLSSPHDLYLKTIAYLIHKEQIKIENFHIIFGSENNSLLPDGFNHLIDSLKQSPVLDIIEKLINGLNLVSIYPNQEIFLARFYNEIKQLTFEKGSNLNTILEWWDSKGTTLNIELAETNTSSIKVLTVHKSKGLQFKHVIIPFAQWSIPQKQDTLWLPGDSFSFHETQGGLFPVNLTKNHIMCNNLSAYYEEEDFANQIDIINILYVANTRAEEGLHLIYQQNARLNSDISKYIHKALNTENELSELMVQTSDNTFELGELEASDKSPGDALPLINITFPSKTNLQVKSTKQSIFQEGAYDNYAAALGSFWHKIFERIIVTNDIEQAVYKQLDLGNINKTQAEILIQQIQTWLSKPEISMWFDSEVKVLTETDIIIPDQQIRRPDRVVVHENGTDIIDYKFGKSESIAHKKQVNEYCELFKTMGFNNVKGYIWYPLLNKVIGTQQ